MLNQIDAHDCRPSFVANAAFYSCLTRARCKAAAKSGTAYLLFRAKGCELPHNPVRFPMSASDDRDWVIKIYHERADAVDQDQNVTYFFLKDYQEICRYMRTIGYGSKGKAEMVEKQVARELERGTYCSLRTTIQGKQSTQDIAFFIYRDLAGDLFGSGLVVVSFDTGGELAKQFTDAWFEKSDVFMKEGPFKE